MSARLVVLAACLAACSSSVQVVRQADPSPFTRSGCKIVYTLIDRKPIPLVEGSAFETANLAVLMQALGPALATSRPDSLPPDANAFVLRMKVRTWDPGAPIGGTARGQVVVNLTDPSGKTVFDELVIDTSGKGGGRAQRADKAGTKLGKGIAKYLRHRVSCAEYHADGD